MSDLLAELEKCTRCGLCQDGCPTYKAELSEGASARGRLKLVKLAEEGKCQWSRENKLYDYIDECLLCGACDSKCPASIPVSELMIKARQKINEQSAAAVEERMPEGPKKTFFERLPEASVRLRDPKYKVAYFCGCITNSFFGEVGTSAVAALQKLNCEVYAPMVECCGEPYRRAGNLEEAKSLAKRNIDIFLHEENLDFIVTDCAACGRALKNYKNLLADDAVYRENAGRFSARVYDLNQFIVEKTDVLDNISSSGKQQMTVTYHDPCQLIRGQKISEAPREILKKIPGVTLVEMEDSDSCCGGPGSYGVTHNRLSRKILQDKMGKVKAAGADCLATACPDCMRQLGYGIRSEQLDMKIMHPIQLLERVLKPIQSVSNS